MHTATSEMSRKRTSSVLGDDGDSKLRKRAKVLLERSFLQEDTEKDESQEMNNSMPKDENLSLIKERVKEKGDESYEQWLKKNVQENVQFLMQLGIHKTKEDFLGAVVTKTKPNNKGLRVKKEAVPRRSSLRLKRISPDGTALPELPPTPSSTQHEWERKPAGTLDMLECLYNTSKDDGSLYVAQLQNIMKSKVKVTSSVKHLEIRSYVKGLDSMKLTADRVRKVVPERIFSVAIHPHPDKVLVASGDKWGRLGLWLVESSLASDGMWCFEPHVRPISCLEFCQENSNHLFSSSYDGTVRRMDIAKGAFDEVYATPEDDDVHLSGFSFISSQTILAAQSDGQVGFVDIRTAGNGAEHLYEVHEKSVKCVTVHPVQRHYFATSGRDCAVNVWDLRKMTKKAKPLTTLRHLKSIDSVYFSPITGNRLLSTSLDDRISVFKTDTIGNDIGIQTTIKHNNFTGRWLSNFRAVWHPRREDLFIVGSMNRPRQIEMYTPDGALIKCFQNDDYLNSVCSLNAFHPVKDALVGGNSSGRMFVFM